MKTISVILLVNNPEMLNQGDLAPYQSQDCYFKLSYINTELKELNTIDDAKKIIPLVVDKAISAEQDGASAIIFKSLLK